MKILPAFCPSHTSALPVLRTATSQAFKGSPVRILNFSSRRRSPPTLQHPQRIHCHSRIYSTKHSSNVIMADHQVVHEPDENRYAIHMEGVPEPAFLRYEIEDSPSGKVYNLTHTYVTPAMRGQGVAAKLVQKAITHAREDDHKIIPTCSYIVAYIKKHEQDRDVVYDQ